jgi:hypothetical protein
MTTTRFRVGDRVAQGTRPGARVGTVVAVYAVAYDHDNDLGVNWEMPPGTPREHWREYGIHGERSAYLKAAPTGMVATPPPGGWSDLDD